MNRMRLRFPREARLSRARDFLAVRRRGERFNVASLRVRALRRRSPVPSSASRTAQSRLGLAVGRRVGGACVRNRWKRAIRRAFRLHRHRLPEPYDILVSVAWGSSEAGLAHVERAFLAIMDKLGRQPPRTNHARGHADD